MVKSSKSRCKKLSGKAVERQSSTVTTVVAAAAAAAKAVEIIYDTYWRYYIVCAYIFVVALFVLFGDSWPNGYALYTPNYAIYLLHV